jgi:hypothetical protein
MMTLRALTGVLALCVFSAVGVRADITTGQAAEAVNKKSTEAGSGWSSALEKSTAEASGQVAAKESAAASLLKEHLAEEERATRLANAKAAAAKLKTGTAAEAAKATARKDGQNIEEDDLLSGVANTVKETLRPLKETAEELKKAKDEAIGIPPIPMIETPKAADPATTDAQGDAGRRQRLVAGILWEEFIAEIKPWAIGIGIAMVLAAGFSRWYAAIRRKSQRPGSHRSSRKSGRHTA